MHDLKDRLKEPSSYAGLAAVFQGVGECQKMKLRRLKEPSTWAGIGLILSAIAPALPLVYATPVGALIGICGGIAYILREGKQEK